MNMTGILSIQKNDFYLKTGILKLYVLQKYIDTSIASISGTSTSSIGLLPYRWYKNLDDANKDKPSNIGTLDIPFEMVFYPQDIDVNRTIKIYPSSDNTAYTILTMVEGHKIFPANIVQMLEHTTLFTDLILMGKLDTNIPYNLLLPNWIKNIILNKHPLGVPANGLGAIIQQTCRYKYDNSLRFSEVLAKDPNIPMVDYVFSDIREMSASSVFGGIAFEDINAMIDSGIDITVNNKKQKNSPLEDLLRL